jgi:hypothetical protein
MVKNGQKPYFRPTLLSSQATTASGDEEYEGCSSEELLTMIRRCWAEDPTERPDFHALKTIIKRINKLVPLWQMNSCFIDGEWGITVTPSMLM